MTTQEFNWLSFLDVADHLVGQSGEAYYRSAISRAYYGVFGYIRDKLRSQGISFRGRDVHRQVIDALVTDNRPAIGRLGQHLNELRRERNFADYQTRGPFEVGRARRAISSARSIRDQVGNLFP